MAVVRLWIPARRCSPEHLAGSPRTLDDSIGARPPQPPRTTRQVLLLVASPAMTGFTTSGRLAVVDRRNEVESGSLALGSRRCCDGQSARSLVGSRRQTGPLRALGCPPAPDRSYMCERAIHMADSFQSARVARVTLAHQSKQRTRRRSHAEIAGEQRQLVGRYSLSGRSTSARMRADPRGVETTNTNRTRIPRGLCSWSRPHASRLRRQSNGPPGDAL